MVPLGHDSPLLSFQCELCHPDHRLQHPRDTALVCFRSFVFSCDTPNCAALVHFYSNEFRDRIYFQQPEISSHYLRVLPLPTARWMAPISCICIWLILVTFRWNCDIRACIASCTQRSKFGFKSLVSRSSKSDCNRLDRGFNGIR